MGRGFCLQVISVASIPPKPAKAPCLRTRWKPRITRISSSNKYAQKSYENHTLHYIVTDLLATYVHAGYGLTSTNVLTGPAINTIGFNHISLRKCFEKLSNVTGYIWWIDYQKDLHFVEKTTDVAPESITDSSENFSEIAIALDTSQVRNSVTVRGGREEINNNFEQIILGYGQAREFILREKPKTLTASIELDTGAGYVAKTYGVDPIDEEGANYFMFNYQEKYIRVASANPVPAKRPIKSAPRIAMKCRSLPVSVTSLASILAMTALEGGDGVHAYAIHDLSITSKSEARDRALQELAEFANPLLTAVLKTRTGLLQSGSIFKPGQKITVNLPTWGINTDTTYLIKDVQLTMTTDGTTIEYHYRVTFGGRLLGVQEFLHSLAGKEDVRLEAEEVFHLEAVEELLTLAEVITRNPIPAA